MKTKPTHPFVKIAFCAAFMALLTAWPTAVTASQIEKSNLKAQAAQRDPAALHAIEGPMSEEAKLAYEQAQVAAESAAAEAAAVNSAVAASKSSRSAAPSGSAVQVTATAGTTGPVSYATLKLAFDAINAGTHQGDITIDILGNTTETATAALNNSGSGSASYTSVLVRPSGGARTIGGTITGAIIKLNGADNVTIDGRIAGSGRNLSVLNGSNASASAAIWLSAVAAGNGASNNVIRNLELACGATDTNANSTYGIIMSGTAISTTSNGDDNDNNQFIFNRIIRCRYGIVTRGVTTNLNIAPIVTDNIIGPSSFGPDQIGKTGILMQADTGAVVSRNIIQFVGGDLSTTTAGADRVGIGIGSEAWSVTASTTLTSNTYTVTKNVIHDIVEERTFSAIGILLATTGGGSATSNRVANNFIYNIRANATSPDQVCGIGIAGGHTDQVVFNSISITGDQDPGATTTSVIFGQGIRLSVANGTTHANLTLANNSIYLDASSNNTATNRYYAITGTSSAYSFGTGFENNNNLYINPSNTQLRTGGLGTAAAASITTEFATLANWQAAYTTPQDAASIQDNPNHASPTSDLHLLGSSPNIDTAVTIAAVTDDIDSQARPNGAFPDIGADEFYASPGTLQLSSTTYSGSEGTTLVATVNRVVGSSGSVGVTYTLADGTATGGAACGAGVDYVNAGPQTLTFNDMVTSQPINITLCTDVVAEPLETFTITLSMPTGGATLGSPTMATATIIDVPPPFNGTYSVGAGQLYTSLTNNGGIFQAINTSGASGDITINIVSDLTGETGVNALNEIAGGFSVTIKPSGSARSVSGSSATQLIKLSGADNVTIDGSLSGGTDRSLTLSNAGAGPIVWVATNATSGANGNTVKNCILSGPGSFAGQGIIAGSGSTLGSPAEFPNSNNTIRNNLIRGVQNAAFLSGNASTYDQNWVVADNTFGSTVVAEKLSFRGMLIGNAQNMDIHGNLIMGVSSSTSTSATMSGIQTSATIIGGQIYNNKISDIKQNNTAGWGANGIYLTSTNVASGFNAPVIYNNFISDITGQGFAGTAATDNGYGIMVTSGGVWAIYYNTIHMNTNQVAAGSITAAINIASGVTAGSLVIDSNIIANSQTVGTRYGVYDGSSAGAAAFGIINYNDYFAQNVGFLGATQATLGDWQTATGQDANSIAADPLFVSTTDLHIQNASPAVGGGNPSSAPATDIDGQTRDAMPDIGADEVIITSPLTANSAASRQTHGGAGTFSIPLPLTGPAGVECRSTGGNYTVVITFSNNVVSGNASVTTGTGTVSGSPTFSTNTMTINLTGVTDVQQITVTATNVTDEFSQVLASTAVPMKVLIGDVNGNSAVNVGDVGATKAQSGLAVTAANFRTDINVNGSINVGDIGLVKSRSGNSLP